MVEFTVKEMEQNSEVQFRKLHQNSLSPTPFIDRQRHQIRLLERNISDAEKISNEDFFIRAKGCIT